LPLPLLPEPLPLLLPLLLKLLPARTQVRAPRCLLLLLRLRLLLVLLVQKHSWRILMQVMLLLMLSLRQLKRCKVLSQEGQKLTRALTVLM
jgi:hypothetical protein